MAPAPPFGVPVFHPLTKTLRAFVSPPNDGGGGPLEGPDERSFPRAFSGDLQKDHVRAKDGGVHYTKKVKHDAQLLPARSGLKLKGHVDLLYTVRAGV